MDAHGTSHTTEVGAVLRWIPSATARRCKARTTCFPTFVVLESLHVCKCYVLRSESRHRQLKSPQCCPSPRKSVSSHLLLTSTLLSRYSVRGKVLWQTAAALTRRSVSSPREALETPHASASLASTLKSTDTWTRFPLEWCPRMMFHSLSLGPTTLELFSRARWLLVPCCASCSLSCLDRWDLWLALELIEFYWARCRLWWASPEHQTLTLG